MNLNSIAEKYSDPNAAREFFEKQCWPDGTVCPFCGLVGEAYRLKAKPDSKSPVRAGVWKCGGCRKQFTVTKGTIFEDSHIPLNIWLTAIHLICASKKGMSAHQLHRMLGVTYKSAWFMVHRLRYAVAHSPLAEQLKGIVEVDETYIGGKHRKADRPRKKKPGDRDVDARNPVDNKQPVLAMVERGGEVRSQHVERVNSANLRPVLRRNIEEGAQIMTDTATWLRGAIPPHNHFQVNHSIEEYGRYENGLCISTNTIEGYFSLLKRGIIGTYHHVGSQHLHRYLSEFDFRYNTRKITDGERTCKMIAKAPGKRLMYKDIVPEKQKF